MEFPLQLWWRELSLLRAHCFFFEHRKKDERQRLRQRGEGFAVEASGGEVPGFRQGGSRLRTWHWLWRRLRSWPYRRYIFWPTNHTSRKFLFFMIPAFLFHSYASRFGCFFLLYFTLYLYVTSPISSDFELQGSFRQLLNEVITPLSSDSWSLESPKCILLPVFLYWGKIMAFESSSFCHLILSCIFFLI